MENESQRLAVRIAVEVDGAEEVRAMAEEAAACLGRAVELLAQLDGREITARYRLTQP